MFNIKEMIEESIHVKQVIITNHLEDITQIAKIWISTIKNGKKMLFCGNGGSAGDSQHIATELIVRLRPDKKRPAIPAIALTTDTSLITAAANDFGYDYIFSRQIEGIGQKGDLLVAISTSGNSPNIIEAVKTAQNKEMKVVGILGKDGGKLKDIADHSIVVPHNNTGRIQESHIMIGHILCQVLEEEVYGK